MAEGEGTPTTDPAGEGKGAAATTAADEAALGDPGKRALDNERQARAAAEAAAKEARDRVAALEKSHLTDTEKAVAEARAEERAAVLKTANERLLAAEIRAAASGAKMRDPGDAQGLLGDTARFVKADGSIDEKGISAAIAELLKAKPYLAATAGNGSGEGGARGGGGGSERTMDDFIRQAAGKS